MFFTLMDVTVRSNNDSIMSLCKNAKSEFLLMKNLLATKTHNSITSCHSYTLNTMSNKTEMS